MKIPAIFQPSRSFATRLSWRVVGTLFLIAMFFSIIAAVIIWTFGFIVLSILFWTRMYVVEERVNNVFNSVEVAVSNNVPEAEESISNKGKEFFAIERLLQFNPNIVGAAIALNPDCEPRKGQLFAPYAFRDSTGIHDKMLSTKEYDYLHKEWFAKPVEMGTGIWTEPYNDMGGGNIMMITYSLPLFNKNGDMYAVSTADVSLDWLTEVTSELDSLNNENLYMGFEENGAGHSKTFIVTANGNFVVHPDKNGKEGTSLSDYIKAMEHKNPQRVIDGILSNEESVELISDRSGKIFLVFYIPLDRTGWVAASIVPFSDLSPLVYAFIIFFLVVLVVALVVIALICRKNIHKLTKPLRLFAKSAEEIAKGHLDAPLPVVKSKDELLTLHNSFHTMQQSLVAQIEEIKKVNEEKGRIEGELLIARNIQMSMLPMKFPAFPERTDIDIYAQLIPAKEVGGDLYDYLIRNEKLYFCVGDVSGKGMPAAMVMAVTRALFRTATSHESNPGKIASGINELLVEDNESNMFTTMFIGVLDLPTGRLRYSNAGHNAPILINASGAEMMQCDANIPLGVMENWRFTTQEILLQQQTTIFMYTDGLTEAENTKYEQFKEERVIKMAQSHGLSPKTIIEQMQDSVSQFTGDAQQNDDLTMLAVEYNKQLDHDVKLSHSIMLQNDVEQVLQLSEFVEQVCEEAELDMSLTMSVNLAIEEAVVNVMNYAYPAGTEGDVQVDAFSNGEILKFVITDWGKPFDPTTKEDIDITLPAEERVIGGLGIHLVRQIMDSSNYERIDGKNVLTLIKKKA